jgi:hypothetical protein
MKLRTSRWSEVGAAYNAACRAVFGVMGFQSVDNALGHPDWQAYPSSRFMVFVFVVFYHHFFANCLIFLILNGRLCVQEKTIFQP